MVATLARLRFQILRNSLKREKWRIILLILGALYAFGVLAVVVVGAFALGVTAEPEARTNLLVLLGSLLVVGWIVVPVLAFGVDDTLDPQRFTILVAPSPRLALGLLVGGAVSIPGLATVLACLAVSLAWLGSGSVGERVLGFVVAVVGGLLGAVLCLLLARLSTTAGAGLLRARRGREVASLIGFALVMLLAFTPSILQSFTFELSLGLDLRDRPRARLDAPRCALGAARRRDGGGLAAAARTARDRGRDARARVPGLPCPAAPIDDLGRLGRRPIGSARLASSVHPPAAHLVRERAVGARPAVDQGDRSGGRTLAALLAR
ncbi:hypothetical protein [Salana multivorans]